MVHSRQFTDKVEAPGERTLELLVRRMAAGQQDALATLYDETKQMVYGLVVRLAGDPVAAEEITLEVYLEVWRQAKKYNPRQGSVMTWLSALARHRALDFARLKGGAQAGLTSAARPASAKTTGIADEAEARKLSERGQVVRAALSSLPLEQREVIELAYFRGLSCGAIASLLSRSKSTVQAQIKLGLHTLSELLRPHISEWHALHGQLSALQPSA